MLDARRGDVVVANLDPTLGVEIKKTRPVVVVSHDSISRLSKLVVVVPLPKNTERLSPSPALIPLGAAHLSFESKAVTEQVKALDKRCLIRRLGRLTPDVLARVERALKNTLAFS